MKKNVFLTIMLLVSTSCTVLAMNKNNDDKIKPVDTNNEKIENEEKIPYTQNPFLGNNIGFEEQEKNSLGNHKPVIVDNKNQKSSFSIFNVKENFTNLLSGTKQVVDTSVKFFNKKYDPETYTTSKENLNLVTTITQKYKNAQTIQELISFNSYCPSKEENQDLKGDFTSKIQKRNIALSYLITKTADELLSKDLKEIDRLQRETKQKFFINVKKDYYIPAIQEMHNAELKFFSPKIEKLLDVNNNNNNDKEDNNNDNK